MIAPNRTWRTASGSPSDVSSDDQDRQDERADDRPAVAAAAAHDRGPADDRRGHRRQDRGVDERDARDVRRGRREEPGDRREDRRDACTGRSGPATTARRTAGRRPGCRRSRTAAGRSRSAAGRSRISSRDRHEDQQAVREDRRASVPGPERSAAPAARPRRSGPSRAARRWPGPRTTRLMPRVMISGWTRKTPTPTPVTNPASAGDDERDDDGDAEALAADQRRHHEPRHRGDRADRQVDAAGQHRQGLAARRGSPAGTAARRIDAGPVRVDDARAGPARMTTTRSASRHEQRDERPVAEHAPPAAARRASGLRARGASPTRRSCRGSAGAGSRLPTMTTPIEDDALQRRPRGSC